MKAFHTITIPHKDILQGRLTMDVFAADLWEVHQKRGPDEYKDADIFFEKTYLTEGLNNLLSIVQKRLSGKGGDPVIQIQTPFGGGKTHALIAMYHKTNEWKSKKVVVVGTGLSVKDTLWGILEKQLTGKISKLSGQVAPGKEALRELISKHQPLLILMDEVLEYATKAAGVQVGGSNLAAQTIAFMQELTEVASTFKDVCVVVTLPSSIIEHYDQHAERLYQQLQKVAGRVEKIYTPVQEYEITNIIRRRLFSQIKESEVKKVVSNFVDYAEKEKILPAGVELSEYKKRFLDAYPFLPDVIDVLYHQWGSFPTFQRTRGVLRLLSLVVHSLKESNKPYISLADFDLGNQEIRQELLKHIGAEFNSVIAADITGKASGSKKVDVSLGDAYRGLSLGTRAATTIFMYSFSGGQEHGVTTGEIKRSATTIGNPASVVAEATEQLRSKLFYLQTVADKYFFSNQPNLNRILLTKMENIKDDKLIALEREILKENITGHPLKVFIWEENSANIPDSEELKMIILNRQDKVLMETILKTKGQTPRVNRNTLIFLYPLESEKSAFVTAMKRKLAYEYIEQDSDLKLTSEQKKEVSKEIKKADSELQELARRFYRMVALPDKDRLKEIDLGIPTYGEEKDIDHQVYEKLRSDGEILEKIAPLVIREKYLSGKDYVSTEQLYQASFKTPGEARILNKGVFEQGLAEGVSKGLFGLGELKEGCPICRYFNEEPSIAFSSNEVIISEKICIKQLKDKEKGTIPGETPEEPVEEPAGGEEGESTATIERGKAKDKVHLKFQVPKGKVSSIMGVINLLQSKFENLSIELTATEGAISEQDYEDKIKETFRQLGIDLEDI